MLTSNENSKCCSSMIRSYGRTRIRGYKKHNQLIAEKTLDINFIQNLYNIEDLFRYGKKYWLEIGFGKGEHVIDQLEQNSDIHFIAIEPFINGSAFLVNQIINDKPELESRVTVICADARNVINLLPPKLVDKVFILFPDPWGKRSHHKRRIINHELFSAINKVSTDECVIEIATDHECYAKHIFNIIDNSDIFKFCNKNVFSIYDCKSPPIGWTVTRYQTKAQQQNKNIFYFTCHKIL